MKICALILASNNESTIEDTVSRCRHVMEPDVLVFDLDSSDRTVSLARAAGAVLPPVDDSDRDVPVNRAFRAASDLGYTHAVLVRADRPDICIPEEIPRLVNAAWESPWSIIAGIGEGVEGSAWTSLLAMRPLKTGRTGFCLFPIEETLALNCRDAGAAWEAEATIRASWARIPIVRVLIHAPCRKTPPLPFGKRDMHLLAGMIIRFPRLVVQLIDEF